MSIKMQLSLKRELQQYYKQKHDQNILSLTMIQYFIKNKIYYYDFTSLHVFYLFVFFRNSTHFRWKKKGEECKKKKGYSFVFVFPIACGNSSSTPQIISLLIFPFYNNMLQPLPPRL